MKLVIASTVAFLLALLANQVETVVTENHYSAWVRARQEQLEADLERSLGARPDHSRRDEGYTTGTREDGGC